MMPSALRCTCLNFMVFCVGVQCINRLGGHCTHTQSKEQLLGQSREQLLNQLLGSRNTSLEMLSQTNACIQCCRDGRLKHVNTAVTRADNRKHVWQQPQQWRQYKCALMEATNFKCNNTLWLYDYLSSCHSQGLPGQYRSRLRIHSSSRVGR